MKASARCLFLVSQGSDSKKPSKTSTTPSEGQCCKGDSKHWVPCRKTCRQTDKHLTNDLDGQGRGMSIHGNRWNTKRKNSPRKSIDFIAFSFPIQDPMLYKLEASFLPSLIFSRLWDRRQKLLPALSYTTYQSAANSPKFVRVLTTL